MKKQLSENRLWFLIASLLVTSALTLGSAFLPNLTSPITNVLLIIGSPFQTAATSITGQIDRLQNYTLRYNELETKLKETEAQLADSRDRLRAVQDALQENADLRAALRLTERKPDLTLLDVIATDGSSTSWESTLTLNKGSRDGIEVNDCVISGTGCLVGIVQEVGDTWARLITVIDPNISISAMIYRTNDTVMLESDLNLMKKQTCKLTYLDDEMAIISGDEILTSGSDDTYPIGLIIGYVQNIQPNASGLGKMATVRPAVSLDSLGTLFVITSFSNK